MSSFLNELRRLKTVDVQFLNHSEWVRKLGTTSVIGIAGVLSVPFGIFVIVPYTITTISGPSALMSLLVASIVMILSCLHINELLCSMPKNCLLYNFAYATFGELPAYTIGWASLLDSVIAVTTVAHAWSDHVYLLFRGIIHRQLVTDIPNVWNASFIEEKFDGCAMVAVLYSAMILCCSLRVAATVSIVMVVVTGLTTSSTVLVGFFHADPNHWLQNGIFKNGAGELASIIRGASCFMCAYVGVEAVSYLSEETHSPRKRIPLVLPFIVFTFTLFLFLVTMIFTMTTDFTVIPGHLLLPNVFHIIKKPSARYIMTVGAVCGLSGAMLTVFLPASRLLASLVQDRLLPCQCVSHSSRKRGIPYVAVGIVAVSSCLLLAVKRELLFDIMTLNMPIRMLLLACLVYVQHYRPDPIGLMWETARYREIGRKPFRTYSLASYLDDTGSVVTAKCASEDDCDESMESSEVLHIYFSQQEAAKLQRRLEKNAQEADEKSALLYCNVDSVTKSPSLIKKLGLALPHSISQYQTLTNFQKQSRAMMEAEDADVKSMPSLTSIEAYNNGHNCIQSPCSPDDEMNHPLIVWLRHSVPIVVEATKNWLHLGQFNWPQMQPIYRRLNNNWNFPITQTSNRVSANVHHRFHLFDREVPELPYCKRYARMNCDSPVCDGSDYRKAINILLAFILASFGACLLLLKSENVLQLYSLVPFLVLMLILVALTVVASRQTTNEGVSRRRCKMPIFPYLTLVVVFLSVLLICSSSLLTPSKLLLWILFGYVVYFLYGFKHSRERYKEANGCAMANEWNAKTAILLKRTSDSSTNSLS